MTTEQFDHNSEFPLKNEIAIKYEDLFYTKSYCNVEESTFSVDETSMDLVLPKREDISDEENVSVIDNTTAVENSAEENRVLRARNYQTMLGTSETLFICLKRENLHQLQKQFKRIERCSLCSLIIKRNNYHVSYLTVHRKKSLHNCRHCDFQRKTPRGIIRHYKNVHDIMLVKCTRCSFWGETLAVLKHHHHRQHRKLKPGSEIYQCYICQYETFQKSKIQLHCNVVHRNTEEVYRFKCHLCDFKTKYRASLNNHVDAHKPSSENMYECDVCQYKARIKQYMEKHMQLHKRADEVKMFKCNICSFETIHQSSLGKHIEVRHAPKKEKWIPCTLCPYEAKDRSYLARHMMSHKNVKEAEKYKCAVCNFTSKYKSSLGRHMKSHNPGGHNVYPCQLCPHKATSNTDLKKHTLVHKNADEVHMYKCEYCPYQSKHKYYMKKHMQSHQETDKKFQCELCDFKTNLALYLQIHIRNVHRSPEKGKMYKCNHCPYKTRYKACLSTHMKLHIPVEERTFFPCDSCDLVSSTKLLLKTHCKRMHSNPKETKKLLCAHCDFQTTQKVHLKMHLRDHIREPSKEIKSSTRKIDIERQP